MKSNFIRMTIALSITTVLMAVSVIPGTAVSPKERKAEKIIEKHIEALGGMEKIKALHSLRIKGHLAGERFEVPVTIKMQRPNRSRLDIDVRGKRMVLAYDGKTAWWINPFFGVFEPARMSEQYAETLLRWTDFEGPLVDYQKKRHRAEYVGQDETSAGTAYDIELSLSSGEVWHVFIDTETFLEVKRTFEQTIGEHTTVVTTYFPEYETVDGVKLYRVIRGDGLEGSAYTMTFDSYETNVELDQKSFNLQ